MEYLIAKGHPHAMKYILATALTFYVLGTKRERLEMVQQMGCIRTAHHADEEGYNKIVKGLI